MSKDPLILLLTAFSNLMVAVNSCVNFFVYIKKDFRSIVVFVFVSNIHEIFILIDSNVN